MSEADGGTLIPSGCSRLCVGVVKRRRRVDTMAGRPSCVSRTIPVGFPLLRHDDLRPDRFPPSVHRADRCVDRFDSAERSVQSQALAHDARFPLADTLWQGGNERMGMDAHGTAIKQRQRPEGWTRLNFDSNPTTARGIKAVTFQTHVPCTHPNPETILFSSLLRHYTAFAGIAHGQKTRKCFDKLVMRIGMRDLCEFSATIEYVQY
jgi:hypothetical protein